MALLGPVEFEEDNNTGFLDRIGEEEEVRGSSSYGRSVFVLLVNEKLRSLTDTAVNARRRDPIQP